MMLLKLTGVSNLQRQLTKAAAQMGMSFEVNAKRAGLYILRESKKIVPVDTSTLKNSGFVRNVGGPGWAADVIVGYTAAYAVFVHERTDLKHKEGKTDHYLDKVIKDAGNRKRVLQIVAGGNV